MIHWKIYKKVKSEPSHMPWIRVGRRLDALVAKKFLEGWNFDNTYVDDVKQLVKRKMYVPHAGYVCKEEYFQYLEFDDD